MYLGHTAKLSGGEIALSRLLPALRDHVDVLVVLAEEGPLVARLESLGIKVRVVPLSDRTRNTRKEALTNPFVVLSRLASVLRYAWTIRRIVRDEQVDLVHTNTLKAGIYGCIAARMAGVPSVWHLRDRLASDYLPRPVVLATRAAISLLPSRVICNSEATMATLPTGILSLRRPRAYVVPSPIRDVLEATEVSRRERERENGREFYVGMVGRLAPWKGQDVVLRAFAAAQLDPPARLVLIGSAMFGEDDYESSLRQEISRLGIDKEVELRGFVDDVLGALQDFDVLVHASTVPEPFGQVIVEGLAVGVPVVATRGGGPSEILTDGVDGLLYDAGDESALAQLLRRLQSDGSLRARLSAEGLRRARDFSSAAVAPLVVELYEDLVVPLRARRRRAA
jgi:glycosyltransferase involved in cell wall biosynthesis